MKGLETAPIPSAQSMPAAQRPRYRLHASTYLVLLVMATVLFFLNVPGERAFEFDVDQGEILAPNLVEHGWPWNYLSRRETAEGVDVLTGTSQPTSLWSLRKGFISFSFWALMGDIVAAIGLTLVVGLGFERWRQRRNSIWQLTVFDLLALTTLVACGTVYVVNAARVYHKERATLREMEYISDKPTFATVYGVERSGPHWLRELVGDPWLSWFDRVVYVAVSGENLEKATRFANLRAVCLFGIDASDAHLAHLATLQRVSAFQVYNTGAWGKPTSNTGMKKVFRYASQLRNLESLEVCGPGFDDKSARAAAMLPRLRTLVVTGTADFSDDGIAALAQCRSLEVIDVPTMSTTAVTSDGIRHLANLPGLRVLRLANSTFGDEVIDALQCLPALEEFIAVGPDMTPQGIARFAEFSSLRRLAILVKGENAEAAI